MNSMQNLFVDQVRAFQFEYLNDVYTSLKCFVI